MYLVTKSTFKMHNNNISIDLSYVSKAATVSTPSLPAVIWSWTSAQRAWSTPWRHEEAPTPLTGWPATRYSTAPTTRPTGELSSTPTVLIACSAAILIRILKSAMICLWELWVTRYAWCLWRITVKLTSEWRSKRARCHVSFDSVRSYCCVCFFFYKIGLQSNIYFICAFVHTELSRRSS